jgi:uncharacterized DUF497 family protein
MGKVTFEWDSEKDEENRRKHGVSFGEAQYAFADPRRVQQSGRTALLLLRQGGGRHIDG